MPYPKDRCQLSFDRGITFSKPAKTKRSKQVKGETLDVLSCVDDELLYVTRARIKKIWEEHSLIGLLHSGGIDSRLILQMMLEEAILNPDPDKKL